MKDTNNKIITEEEFTKDVGHKTEQVYCRNSKEHEEKKCTRDCAGGGGALDLAKNNSNQLELRDLFDEYAGVMYVGYMETVESQENRKAEIISEAEQLIRKEVLEEVLSLGVPKDAKFVSKVIFTHQIHDYAKSKGIIINK